MYNKHHTKPVRLPTPKKNIKMRKKKKIKRKEREKPYIWFLCSTLININ